jgi:hypothetical protein
MDDEYDEFAEAEDYELFRTNNATSAAGDFVAFLKRCSSGAEPSCPTRLPHFWHRGIHRWSSQDLDEAIRLAEANTTVQVLSVDEAPEHDVNGAARIGRVLQRFRNAKELVVRAAPRQRDGKEGVDALLRGRVSGSHANLTVLRLFAAGGDKEMFEFLNRFPHLSTVELGERDKPVRVSTDLLAALASHWASGEASLEQVSLHCRRASALDVARLLYPLGHCPQLMVLDVTLPDPKVLHDVCVVCATRPSIERLAVAFALGGHRYTNDAFPLLTYCRDFPDSLKSLSLRNCLLRLSEVRDGRVAVRKVTSLELVSCDGAPLCLVLERFPNLERLHMGAEDDVIEDGRIPYMIKDAELDKFAHALPSTKVNDLSLHVRPWEPLPSLVALLQNGRGSNHAHAEAAKVGQSQ